MDEFNSEKKYNYDPMTGERITREENEETQDTIQNFRTDTEQKADSSEFIYEEPVKESRQPETKTGKKEKKPASFGKRFAAVVALAVVFGLVGGLVFTGVNYAGSKLVGTAETPAAAGETAAEVAMQELVKPDAAAVDPEKDVQEASDLDKDTTAVPSTTGTGTVADVAANCLPSVVTIASVSVVEMQNIFGQKQQYEASGGGSGVIVGQNETELLIATNYHVVSSATSLSVGFVDESSAEAFVKGTDSENDLAVIAVKLEDLTEDTLNAITIAVIGDSDSLVLGEQVVAIGNALGLGQSVTAGYVSALNRDMTFSDGTYSVYSTQLIQTDAPINSGNSGGGLFNMKGELIGINEAKSSTSSSGATVDGVGYAISIAKAEPILEELMTLVTRTAVAEEDKGYLGINYADVTADIASMYNMPQGVCFTNVLAGSPADKAGIKKGDVLIKLEGHEINDYEDLKDNLQYYAAGDTVELVIMRSNNGEYEEVTVSVTLESYEAVAALQQ